MKFEFKLSQAVLLLILSSLLITGLDLTHHSHNAWFYHDMIKAGNFTSTSPYFTSQITYAYGVPAYFIAGLLWFVFGIHTINLIIGLTIVINYIILKKWLKNDYWISFLILINLFFTIFDSYVAAFSNCLFWLASYAYFKKKKWWSIPLLIAAFNHPYVLISSLFFAVQTPILIIPLSLMLSYFLVASVAFTSGIFLPIYTIFMALGRIVTNLLPIMLLTARDKLNLKNFKIIEKLSKIKIGLPALFGILIISVPLIIFLTIYTLVLVPDTLLMDYSMFEGIPLINDTVRVVDYLYLPSVYVLPFYGFNLEAGSFRENNPQHMVSLVWNNKTEYDTFLESNELKYVLMCKMCNPKSNERQVLRENYPLIWENEYYYLYNVS